MNNVLAEEMKKIGRSHIVDKKINVGNVDVNIASWFENNV